MLEVFHPPPSDLHSTRGAEGTGVMEAIRRDAQSTATDARGRLQDDDEELLRVTQDMERVLIAPYAADLFCRRG